MITKAQLKSWGSSLGVVVPKEVVKAEHLKEGDEITIEIHRKSSIREIFGSMPNLKIDAQKMKDEIRKEWS